MTKFILRRILQAIPTMFGITVISYFIMSLAPGGPSAAMTFDPHVPRAQREAMTEKLGFNDPVVMQYGRWLLGDAPIRIAGVTLWEGRETPIFSRRGKQTGVVPEADRSQGIIRGDFGRSLFYKRPVMDMIGERVEATIQLGLASLIIGFMIGIPIGILAAVRQGGIFDNITRVTAVFFNAVPVFWLGLLLLLIFGKWLDWLPMGNRCPLTLYGCENISDYAVHMILPTFTLATGWIAILSRYMRTSTLEVLSQDYVRTAYSKGLNNQSVWYVHASRNALLPVVTILGPAIPNLIGGALITETIFSWPGLGRLSYEAVLQQDYPMVMAVVIISGVVTVVGYLLSDVMYAMVDPRIRLG